MKLRERVVTSMPLVELWRDHGPIRRNVSNFALAKDEDLAPGLLRLQADLESGAWDRKYGNLRSLPELDLGHRVLLAEL